MDISKDTKDISKTSINGRRDFIKKAVYTAPVILTMAAAPSFASSGSGATNPTLNPSGRNPGP